MGLTMRRYAANYCAKIPLSWPFQGITTVGACRDTDENQAPRRKKTIYPKKTLIISINCLYIGFYLSRKGNFCSFTGTRWIGLHGKNSTEGAPRPKGARRSIFRLPPPDPVVSMEVLEQEAAHHRVADHLAQRLVGLPTPTQRGQPERTHRLDVRRELTAVVITDRRHVHHS